MEGRLCEQSRGIAPESWKIKSKKRKEARDRPRGGKMHIVMGAKDVGSCRKDETAGGGVRKGSSVLLMFRIE